MRVLTKNDILQAEDLKMEQVSVPEWGGDLYVSEITADARDEFEQYMFEQRKGKYAHVRAALVAMTLVNEQRERLFSFEDIVKLGKKSGLVLDRLFDIANKLNKLYGPERETLEKNSETPQGSKSDGE